MAKSQGLKMNLSVEVTESVKGIVSSILRNTYIYLITMCRERIDASSWCSKYEATASSQLTGNSRYTQKFKLSFPRQNKKE